MSKSGLADDEIKKLLELYLKSETLGTTTHSVDNTSPDPMGDARWFEKQTRGLTRDGIKQLKELEEQLRNPGTANHVDRKRLRYLRKMKNMPMKVPDMFRDQVTPKTLYKRLVTFCRDNDIPEEIVARMIPALITFIKTGYMRPIIFVGEKGCGKTTALRLLVQKALRLPVEVIKIPQTDGGHGLTGDCGVYQSADAGYIALAMIRANTRLVAYIFDEIDKASHDRNRASIDDELLSITDDSSSEVYDNYLEIPLVGLEHCPKFFTCNDIDKVSPILADRCTIIQFPNADAARIKSISKKYVDKILSNNLYSMIKFDYELMDKHIDHLVHRDITSLRKHQQMIEAVLENALNLALLQESDEIITVTDHMFKEAESSIMCGEKARLGFAI